MNNASKRTSEAVKRTNVQTVPDVNSMMAKSAPSGEGILNPREHADGFSANNNIDEYSFRSKMLKMVGRVVQILEEQRDPKIVVERVVLENARYFDELLTTNVSLPLN